MTTTTTRRGFVARLAAVLAAVTAVPQLLRGHTTPAAADGPKLDVQERASKMITHQVFTWDAAVPVRVDVRDAHGNVEWSMDGGAQGVVSVPVRPWGERRTVVFTASENGHRTVARHAVRR